MSDHYDLVIIGSGPAGEAAAMCAAKQRLKVAMVEKHLTVGGNCTHLGTIPSKALRHLIRQSIRQQRYAAQTGLTQQRPDYQSLLSATQGIVNQQAQTRSQFYLDNGVELIHGEGHLVSDKAIDVTLPSGRQQHLTANNIVLSTGSRPYQPPSVDFNHPRIFDSDSILSMEYTPKHIVIYGAGVIGCEYASIFCGLGIRVDLVNTRANLLDFLDDEITDALSYHLRDQGAIIRHQEEFDRVAAYDDHIELFLNSGKRIKADCLLWANGRSGNSDKLGLDKVNLAANSRGYIAVNEYYQTDVPSIYAVGDLIGQPSLASASYDQGRFCAELICGNPITPTSQVPTGIYTIPGISSVGQTEAELTADNVPYEIGQAFFKKLARGNIVGEKVGMLKLLFHAETRALLGIHCFGYQAMEIIHVGQAILSQPSPNNKIDYFINTTFNYPTMAEAYRVAAINGINRLFGR